MTDQVCPSCGVPVACGAAAGAATCWCMEKPSGLFSPTAGGQCYCPACLEQRIAQATAAQAKTTKSQ